MNTGSKTKARRKPVTFRKPSHHARLLQKRSHEDHIDLVELLENDKEIPAQLRETYAAMLLLDYEKLERSLRQRFDELMSKGTADEQRRIACLLNKK